MTKLKSRALKAAVGQSPTRFGAYYREPYKGKGVSIVASTP